MSKIGRLILILSFAGNLTILYVAYKALEYRSHINYFLYKYNNVVSEFSGRARYENDDILLKSDTLVNNRVVFLGSQVIENWTLAGQFGTFEAINRGIAGQRVSGFLLRFRPDVIELRPKAVVIEVSSYNFRPESPIRDIQDYIISLSDMAIMNHIVPINCTVIPIPVCDARFNNYHLSDSLSAYNHWLKEYCQSHAIPCADFNKILSDNNGFQSQGLAAAPIQPNVEGYRCMANAVLSILDSLK